jgi:hypothetical protein
MVLRARLGGSSLQRLVALDVLFSTNAPFTFVFNGDTTGVFHGSPTLLANPATLTTISITGFGSGHFTQAVDAGLDLADNAAGFANPLDPTNIILAQNAGFAAWKLATTFGPLEQVGSAFAASGSSCTSLGTLVVTGAENVSFGAVVTALPEPATFSLVALSLLGAMTLGLVCKR